MPAMNRAAQRREPGVTPLRSWTSFVVLACLAVLPDRVRAQTSNDLSVTSIYSGYNSFGFIPFFTLPTSTGGSITLTRVQTFELVASNEAFSDTADVFVDIEAGPDLSAVLTAVPSPGCALSGVGPPINGLRWQIGVLAARSTRRCTLTLRAVPSSPPVISSVLLAGRIGSASNVDPLPANNRSRAVLPIVSQRDFVRDVGLSIESPRGILAAGQVYEVDFTVTNSGPGEEGYENFTQLAYSDFYRVGPRADDFFALGYIGDPDCRYRVTDIGSSDTFSRSAEIIFGRLAPGQSRTCTMGIFILPGGTGTRLLNFYIWAEGPGEFDTNLANNTATLRLQYSAPAVSVLSGHGRLLLLLALLLGGVAAVAPRARALPLSRRCR